MSFLVIENKYDSSLYTKSMGVVRPIQTVVKSKKKRAAAQKLADKLNAKETAIKGVVKIYFVSEA